MTKAKSITLCILLTFMMAAFSGSILAGEQMTIAGVVTDDGQIVDKNGGIYEIGENDNFEAISENTDVKVEVKGIIEEDESGYKIIMIESFRVLE